MDVAYSPETQFRCFCFKAYKNIAIFFNVAPYASFVFVSFGNKSTPSSVYSGNSLFFTSAFSYAIPAARSSEYDDRVDFLLCVCAW